MMRRDLAIEVGGFREPLWVVALTEVPVLLIIWYGMAKYKILLVKHELRSLLFITASILVGYGLLQLSISSG
jgi:hypothetical protein